MTTFNENWKEKAQKRRKSWAAKAKRFAESHAQLEDIRKEVYFPLGFSTSFDLDDYIPLHFCARISVCQGDSNAEGEEGEDSTAASQEPSEKQDGDSAGGGSSSLPESPQEAHNAAPSQDYTSLWEEDAFMGQQITDIIHSTTQWGSLPGSMVELIQKAAEGRIDFRNAWRHKFPGTRQLCSRATRLRRSHHHD